MVALDILLKQAAAGKVFNQLPAQRLVVCQSPAYGWLRIALAVAVKAMGAPWLGDSQLRQTRQAVVLLPFLQPLYALGTLQLPIRPAPLQQLADGVG